MVFSSAIFLLGFLPATFLCSLLIRKEYSNIFLLAASLIFYSWGEPYYILLMVFSIAVNWGAGAVLSSCRGGRGRRFWQRESSVISEFLAFTSIPLFSRKLQIIL